MKDVSLKQWLLSKGVSDLGLQYADVKYAQTSAASLDQLGVKAMQEEACRILSLFY
jgi:hypothetical protein